MNDTPDTLSDGHVTAEELDHARAVLVGHDAAAAMPVLDVLLASMSPESGGSYLTDTDVTVQIEMNGRVVTRAVAVLYLLGLLAGWPVTGRNGPFLRVRGPELERWHPVARCTEPAPETAAWRITAERMYVRQILHDHRADNAAAVADRIIDLAAETGSTAASDFDLARATGTPTGTVRSHLGDLQALGIIESHRGQLRRGWRLWPWCPLHTYDGLMELPEPVEFVSPAAPLDAAEVAVAVAVLDEFGPTDAIVTLRAVLGQMDGDGLAPADTLAIREAVGHVLTMTTIHHVRALYRAGLLEAWTTADGRAMIRRGPKLRGFCPRRGKLAR